MQGMFEAFRALILAVIILIIGFVANAILQETLPTFALLRARLDQYPSIWIGAGVVIALIVTYFGHIGNEKRVNSIETAGQRSEAKLVTQRDGLVKRVTELESLLEEERRLRGVDVLTGLPNHIRFDSDLAVLLKQREAAKDYSLVYVDLFGLKQINDTQGDIFGSRFIQAASSIIAQAMYRKEAIYRAGTTQVSERNSTEIYRSRDGGDEFFLLLKANEKEAIFAVRRIVRDLIDARHRLKDAAQSPLHEELDLKIGFRAGIVSLADFDSPTSVTYAVKSALLHTRRQDLPNAPSKYIVLGTAPEVMAEDLRPLLGSIDTLIDEANQKP